MIPPCNIMFPRLHPIACHVPQRSQRLQLTKKHPELRVLQLFFDLLQRLLQILVDRGSWVGGGDVEGVLRDDRWFEVSPFDEGDGSLLQGFAGRGFGARTLLGSGSRGKGLLGREGSEGRRWDCRGRGLKGLLLDGG